MTEEDARTWIRDRYGVPRETLLDKLVLIVSEGAAKQNLIAPSTLSSMWTRHIVDSAQLLAFAENRAGIWVDVGTGAGFPGLVVACLRQSSIILCEPRKRRAEFLESAITRLELGDHVRVATCKIEALQADAAIISARAVAPLPALLAATSHLSDRETLWLLPKGRGAREEVAAARKTWQGSFHVEQSLTQSDSLIVVATGVMRR